MTSREIIAVILAFSLVAVCVFATVILWCWIRPRSTRALLFETGIVCIRPERGVSLRYLRTITKAAELQVVREALISASRVGWLDRLLFSLPQPRHNLCIEFQGGEQRYIVIGDPPEDTKIYACNVIIDKKVFVIRGSQLERAFPCSKEEGSDQ